MRRQCNPIYSIQIEKNKVQSTAILEINLEISTFDAAYKSEFTPWKF